jgi:similar to stage IV sporulation protein
MPEKNLIRVKVNVETVEDIGEFTSITIKDEVSAPPKYN